MAKLIFTLLLLLLPSYAFAQTRSDLEFILGVDSKFFADLKANFAGKIEKLSNESHFGTCQEQQKDLNRLKTADLARRESQADLLADAIIGHDSITPQAYSDMMLPSLGIKLAEFNLKICQIHQSFPTNNAWESSRRSTQLYCYRDAQLQLNRTKVDWDVIDSRYADSPTQAFAEKMRSYDSNMTLLKCD